jgi:hypothetical protein
MKRLILESVAALLLMSRTADAACLYQGVSYSEGARVCMHKTMFMCRGKQWIKTAERCWERSVPQESSLPYVDLGLPGAPAPSYYNVTADDAIVSQGRLESYNCTLRE